MTLLIDADQSVFMKRRCILDNIVTAEELIFSIHKRRLPGHILKVDFAKAFDLVDWDFLFDLLKARGFGDRWWARFRIFYTPQRLTSLLMAPQMVIFVIRGGYAREILYIPCYLS